MKKKKLARGFSLLLAGALLLGGCAKSGSSQGTENQQRGTQTSSHAGDAAQPEQNDTASMGRFMDRQVELPGEMGKAAGLVQGDGMIRAVDGGGYDLVSKDGGQSFQYDTKVAEGYQKLMEAGDEIYRDSNVATPSGIRLVSLIEHDEETDGNHYIRYLYTADGQEKELNGLPDAFLNFSYGDDGYFYAAGGQDKVYRIDSQTGENTLLFETGSLAVRVMTSGNYLFVTTDKDLMIYDLEKRELADQDPVLDDFLKSQTSESSFGEYSSFLICRGSMENSIYVLNQKGLYQHVLYGTVMEQIIDGSLCSIGDASKAFAGMTVIEGEERDEFLILYNDGALMRYTYDDTVPTIPDVTMRVFSLTEDENVRLAVSAYQLKHPEMYVKYEVGVSRQNGMTADDALKNLSTELAAGKGPDVLMMDHIPYDSYVEKGVLMDLSGLFSAMQKEDPLYEGIVENYRRDGKLYTIPAVFSIPVLAGKADEIEGVQTLSDLADMVEKARQQKPQGSLVGFSNPEDTLTLLSQASSGAWTKEDGSLDTQELTQFLTQCKRIYDAQMSGLDQETQEFLNSYEMGILNDVSLERYSSFSAASAVSTGYYLNQPYSLGLLSGTMNDVSIYLATLKAQEQSYVMMPGQMRGACIPSSLAAVNNGAAEKDRAQDFVKYLLSGEFQGSSSLSAAPISRAGYLARQEFPYGDYMEREDAFMVISSTDESGISKPLEIAWPSEEEIADLNGMVENFEPISSCDDRIYNAVLELGPAALTGESGIEEAVNAIEKKVQLYLAE